MFVELNNYNDGWDGLIINYQCTPSESKIFHSIAINMHSLLD